MAEKNPTREAARKKGGKEEEKRTAFFSKQRKRRKGCQRSEKKQVGGKKGDQSGGGGRQELSVTIPQKRGLHSLMTRLTRRKSSKKETKLKGARVGRSNVNRETNSRTRTRPASMTEKNPLRPSLMQNKKPGGGGGGVSRRGKKQSVRTEKGPSVL